MLGCEFLTDEEEEKVLKRLVEIHDNPEELAKFTAPEWILREVLASIRLSEDVAEDKA